MVYSGSKIDRNLYKARPFSFMSKGKNVTEEVPADGLLLQSADAISWKEKFLDRCKKWGCIDILDTYPAEESSLDS